MSKKIGFLMGSFDPIHIGHLFMASEALNNNLVDEVVFVPTFQNPWKPQSTDFWQRCDLVKMALDSMNNCSISTVESKISAPFYSYKTLEKLRDVYPTDKLYIIVGADVASEIKLWEHGDWILNNFELIIVNRNGIIYDGRVDIMYTINVSSTAVREMYKKGRQVCPLVPAKVDHFIKKYKIYE